MGLLLFIITFIGVMLVQMWLKSTYGKWSKVQNASGLTGAETAQAILRANGLSEVRVDPRATAHGDLLR
jgi:uncharacterized protein